MNAGDTMERIDIIKKIREESLRLIEQKDYERAVQKIQRCLHLSPGPKRRAAILDDLGFAYLKLGW